MTTSVPVSGLVAFINALTLGVAAANQIATTADDVNVAGTVIGIGQTAQSVTALATSDTV